MTTTHSLGLLLTEVSRAPGAATPDQGGEQNLDQKAFSDLLKQGPIADGAEADALQSVAAPLHSELHGTANSQPIADGRVRPELPAGSVGFAVKHAAPQDMAAPEQILNADPREPARDLAPDAAERLVNGDVLGPKPQIFEPRDTPAPHTKEERAFFLAQADAFAEQPTIFAPRLSKNEPAEFLAAKAVGEEPNSKPGLPEMIASKVELLAKGDNHVQSDVPTSDRPEVTTKTGENALRNPPSFASERVTAEIVARSRSIAPEGRMPEQDVMPKGAPIVTDAEPDVPSKSPRETPVPLVLGKATGTGAERIFHASEPAATGRQSTDSTPTKVDTPAPQASDAPRAHANPPLPGEVGQKPAGTSRIELPAAAMATERAVPQNQAPTDVPRSAAERAFPFRTEGDVPRELRAPDAFTRAPVAAAPVAIAAKQMMPRVEPAIVTRSEGVRRVEMQQVAAPALDRSSNEAPPSAPIFATPTRPPLTTPAPKAALTPETAPAAMFTRSVNEEATRGRDPAAVFAEALATAETTSSGTTAERVAIQREVSVVPMRITQSIADAARALALDRPVEITLNPEELGRVRLGLQAAEQGMVVTINVERPETLELLRRNIELLAEQLREIGYQDLEFSFEQSWQDETFDDEAQNEGVNASEQAVQATADDADASVIHRTELALDGRLDMRL